MEKYGAPVASNNQFRETSHACLLTGEDGETRQNGGNGETSRSHGMSQRKVALLWRSWKLLRFAPNRGVVDTRHQKCGRPSQK